MIEHYLHARLFMPSLWQSITTGSRNEHTHWDPKPLHFLPRTSKLQEIPSRFLLPELFFLCVGYTSPPLPITPSPLSAFLCPALGPGCLTPLKGITAALCFLVSFGFRQREALARDQAAGEDEVGVFFFLIYLCVGAMPLAISGSLHGHSSCCL